jgi:multiple sugar transport system permease protein
MLFYLASLQSIPHEVYEAAAIDGAGPWQAFWRVTFPLLKPGHFFVATVGVIGGLQLFDQALIAGSSNGDPNYSLMTVVLYLYNAAFVQLNPGYAAAVGVILFAVVFGATLLQRRIFGNTEAA